jgi:hydroxyacylglutathione hydrolase
MKIEQFFLEGLGHQSYFVTDEQSGIAAIVDPRRDVDVYLQAAQRTGTRITHILETHIHNDYVTGARELAAQAGAMIVASALSELAYEHHPVRDGEQFSVGRLTFSVLATPGHTPEHVSYALYEPEHTELDALFSGGCMLVGNAGRTDLLGEAMTLSLTRQQYQSLRRLLDTLPGHVRVYPTHGAGSFCASSSGVGPVRSTTIAQERLANPAALAKDEAEFVQQQIAGYIAYPTYYKYMHDINQNGPRILGTLPTLPALSPHVVQAHMKSGMPLVDGRNRDVFAREHIPGSLNVEVDSSFATYVGWILPFNVPLMLLIEDEQGRREAVVQLIRIGYEQVEGYVDGGIDSWKAAALPTSQFQSIDIETLYKRWSRHEALTIVDVRRDDEWSEGHIPDALHLPLWDIAQHLDALPTDRPLAVMCRSGYRAEIAASMIAATEREVIAVRGGMPDWIHVGFPTSTEKAPALTDYQPGQSQTRENMVY